VIVCLLICLITGKRPDKANRDMIGWYLIGLASRRELLDHLNRPDHTGVKKRAKDELWKNSAFDQRESPAAGDPPSMLRAAGTPRPPRFLVRPR